MSAAAASTGAPDSHMTSSKEWDDHVEQEALRQWEALQRKQQANATQDNNATDDSGVTTAAGSRAGRTDSNSALPPINDNIVPAEKLFGPVATLNNEKIRDANRQTLEEMGISSSTQDADDVTEQDVATAKLRHAIHELDVGQRVAAIHEKVRLDVENARLTEEAARAQEEAEANGIFGDVHDVVVAPDNGGDGLEEWAARRAKLRRARGAVTAMRAFSSGPPPSQKKPAGESLLDKFEQRLADKQAAAVASIGRSAASTTAQPLPTSGNSAVSGGPPQPSGAGAISPNRASLPNAGAMSTNGDTNRKPLRQVPKPVMSRAEKEYLERRSRFSSLEVDPTKVTGSTSLPPSKASNGGGESASSNNQDSVADGDSERDGRFAGDITKAIENSDSAGLQDIMRRVREQHSPTALAAAEAGSPARGSTKSLLRLRQRKYTNPTDNTGADVADDSTGGLAGRKNSGRVVGPGEWDSRVKVEAKEIAAAQRALDEEVKQQKEAEAAEAAATAAARSRGKSSKKGPKKPKLSKDEIRRNSSVLLIQTLAQAILAVEAARTPVQAELATWEKENLAAKKVRLQGGVSTFMSQLRACEARLSYALPTLQRIRLARYGARPSSDIQQQHLELLSSDEREQIVRKMMADARAEESALAHSSGGLEMDAQSRLKTAEEQAVAKAAAARRQAAEEARRMQDVRERARAMRAAQAGAVATGDRSRSGASTAAKYL
eukprot:INCI10441.5.p1 GENE.INCI10441.5~~INCI10441.5.p1  ORF type:complete len:722 (+),score=172.49 INCI10441.5:115-2280(+)